MFTLFLLAVTPLTVYRNHKTVAGKQKAKHYIFNKQTFYKIYKKKK